MPAGVDSGMNLRVNGEGEPGQGGPGNLYVVLSVDEHPIFERDGADVHVKVRARGVRGECCGPLGRQGARSGPGWLAGAVALLLLNPPPPNTHTHARTHPPPPPHPTPPHPTCLGCTCRARLARWPAHRHPRRQVRLSLAEAVLGSTVVIPTLAGLASLKVPPGTQTGDRRVMQGRGIRPAGRPSGHQFVHFEVLIPKELSDRQKALIEEFGEEQEPLTDDERSLRATRKR